MTYEEAIKMLSTADIYHKNEYGFNSKWKIVPEDKYDYLKYINDLLNKGIHIDNEYVVKYSSNNRFAIQSFLCRFLAEENFKS